MGLDGSGRIEAGGDVRLDEELSGNPSKFVGVEVPDEAAGEGVPKIRSRAA